MSEATERIHPATPYHRQVARREGRVARSRDLTAAALVLVGLLILWHQGEALAAELGRVATESLGGRSVEAGRVPVITADVAVEQWRSLMARSARHLLPLFAGGLIIAIATNIGQVGFLFLPNRVVPNWHRVSPLNGLQRVCSWDNLGGVLWGLIKVAVVGIVAVACVWNSRHVLLSLSHLSAPTAAAAMVTTILWAGVAIAAAMFVLGIVDYIYQWWRREQALKMTPEQLREEMRGRQGNAAVARRRQPPK